MIPKIIHYCWFGNNEMSELELHCIASWKKYLPDHELMLWNETNSPMDHPYMQIAYKNKKWANLSNFTRLYALDIHGGWYFDTDVELIKTPNFSNYKEKCFLGLETKPGISPASVNNAVIASVQGNLFIKKCIQAFPNRFSGTELANLSSPVLTTDVLTESGFKDKPGVFRDVRVFPFYVFYPSSFDEIFDPKMLTSQSVSIHHFKASWFSVIDMSDEELRNLIKKNAYYKKKYKRMITGEINFIELFKINLKFLFRLIR